MNFIYSVLKKPPLYTKTQIPFWDDEHISSQMLKAHLAPDFEGASRKLQFIEKSVRWIEELVPATSYHQLIDFGCGPGIYAEKFTQAGYKVTGISGKEEHGYLLSLSRLSKDGFRQNF